jgi:ATP-dependent RNA helicase HelY
VARLRAALRRHPVHRCPEREEHLRSGERADRAARQADQLRRRRDLRSGALGVQFDRVCAVLTETGYLADRRVTPAGEVLRRLFGTLDLVAAECLREGVWAGLGPADLAACAAALTFVTRSPDGAGTPALPPGRVREVLATMEGHAERLRVVEDRHRVQLLRPVDLGFCLPVWRWASGHRLEAVLLDAELGAGDFVRASRQVVDLLGQLADAAPDAAIAATARAAGAAVRRGIVAYDPVAETPVAETPVAEIPEAEGQGVHDPVAGPASGG